MKNNNENLGFLNDFQSFNNLKQEYEGNLFPLLLSIFISLIVSGSFYAFLFLQLDKIIMIFLGCFILLFLFLKFCFKKLLHLKIKKVENDELRHFLQKHKHLKDFGYSYYRELLKEKIKERGI